MVGFVLPKGGVEFRQSCDIDQALPLIADLDETFISAKSATEMEKEVNRLRSRV